MVYLHGNIACIWFLHVAPSFQRCLFGARRKVFRKNAIISPLYTLMLLFVFFVGFTAILKVPGLVGADADLSFFAPFYRDL